jgi:hypothetical protein
MWRTIRIYQVDGFTIDIATAPDIDTPPRDDTDLFMVRVSAGKAGIQLGADYLGGCDYPTEEAFIASGYLEQMIAAAIREARETIRRITEE